MNISCCINTFKRPQFLNKCLYSLLTQNEIENISLEIIVVDNDPLESGRKTVEELNNNLKSSIKYFVQPVKNISLTRNKAVSEAKGDLILFIDDDGYADSNLLKSYLECMNKYRADALFGQVIPYYEEGVAQWIRKGNFFYRSVQKTGEKSKFTRTGNSIVKAELLKSIEGPFDPQFGLTGGEDINMFGQLAAKGAKFIFCAEAIVYDYVPKDRANPGWLTRRYYRTGLTFTERVINNSKYKFFRELYEVVKGIVYIAVSFLLVILYLPIKHKCFFWYLKIVGNIGHVAAVFGSKYEEYNK